MMHKLTLATLVATLTAIMTVGSMALASDNSLQDQANQKADSIQAKANQKADAIEEQAKDKAEALKQQASNLTDSASKHATQIKDQGKEEAKSVQQRADQKTAAINNSHKHSDKKTDKKVASTHLSKSQILTYQQNLKQLGYLNGKPDGVMGPKTHKAISKFQSDKKLAVNGKLDHKTQQLLSQNAGQAGK